MTDETSMPELDYIRLRAALELFGKPASELDAEQIEQAERQARREYDIETHILSSVEAAGVTISEEETRRALAQVRERFPDEDAFLAALAHNRLDERSLRLGLARQCRVNTVLERIMSGADAEPISDIDVGIYYHAHFDSFQQPERREIYHILVSVNEDFPENSRDRAKERILRIAERLAQKPKSFEELALKHSECPTAMRGGRIGLVRRGQLYPELDAAAFSMSAGQIGEIVESEMGFHLLWCKSVHRPETISLKKAAPHIRKILRERMKENRMRNWIADLTQSVRSGLPRFASSTVGGE